MEAAIRPKLSRAAVEAIVRDRLGPDLEFVSHEEFTDGYFNAAHAVGLADGRELVVKVAPDADLKLLRYEVDLMAAEIEFFERAGAAGVPLPKLWHRDPVGGVMIMDRLKGLSLPKAAADMPAGERLPLRRSIGELGALINTVEGPRFGYPRKDEHTWANSWSESFLTMIDDVLADSTELGIPLPRPADEIGRLIASYGPLLDTVTRPALVHFDLWDGNIFVRRDGTGWEVEGFIDGERAFYGDPLAELVSLVTFIEPEDGEAVLDGYLGRALTDEEERRLCMYRVYLWLILTTETGVRGYDPETNRSQFEFGTKGLVKDLAVLNG